MDRLYYRDEIFAMASSLDREERHTFFNELAAKEKNPVVMFGFNAFLGTFGVDRFILGDIGLGFLKLITLGGLGVWVIVDYFLIGNRTRVKNLEHAHAIYTRICGHPPQPL